MGRTKPRAHDDREELIQQAIKAIQGGLEGGVPAAVEIYGVPQTTLYNQLAGTCRSRQVAHVPQQCVMGAPYREVNSTVATTPNTQSRR